MVTMMNIKRGISTNLSPEARHNDSMSKESAEEFAVAAIVSISFSSI